jgi:hypothetical protein
MTNKLYDHMYVINENMHIDDTNTQGNFADARQML